MFRRIFLLALLVVALILQANTNPAQASCRMSSLIGLWERDNGGARLRFFSNQRVDCRLCQGDDPDVCEYIVDPTDAQGRKQCKFTHPGGKETTLATWSAKDGVLDRLSFADGTSLEVGKGCQIAGDVGAMTIPGLGTFKCHYNYHCNKLTRDE
jgi:hypothetical protein